MPQKVIKVSTNIYYYNPLIYFDKVKYETTEINSTMLYKQNLLKKSGLYAQRVLGQVFVKVQLLVEIDKF